MTASFMKPFVTANQEWWEIDGDYGVFFYPQEYFSRGQAMDAYGGKVSAVHPLSGYGARMSADGYMDCTEWAVFPTVEEAEKYLKDTYLDDEKEENTE